MVAHNNYFWTEKYKEMDFIANGEIVCVRRVRRTRELYGFRFADVVLSLPDRDDFENAGKRQCLARHTMPTHLLCQRADNDLFYAVLEDYARLD